VLTARVVPGQSNHESKFDFLATSQQLGKIDGGTTKNNNRIYRVSANHFSPSPGTTPVDCPAISITSQDKAGKEWKNKPDMIARQQTRTNNPLKNMHPPGIEPGSPAWQAEILPLDHGCCLSEKENFRINNKNYISFFYFLFVFFLCLFLPFAMGLVELLCFSLLAFSSFAYFRELPLLLVSVSLAVFGGLLSYALIPSATELFINARLYGIDLSKRTTDVKV